MSKNLQIEVPTSLPDGAIYDANMGCLVLKDAENQFFFSVKEMPNFAPGKPVPPKPFKELTEKEFYAMSYENRWGYNHSQEKYNKENAQYNTKQKEYNKKLKALRASVSWAWQLVGNGVTPQKITHNESVGKGLNDDNLYTLRFPAVAEGGGFVWLEAFTDNDPAVGRAPFGLFVQAAGTPKIIRVEWTDQNYEPIPKGTTIDFGSQVLLHIYTAGLYGQEVEVELFDKNIFFGDAPLPIADKKAFTREITLQPIKPFEKGKKGESGFIVDPDQKQGNTTVEGDTVVQKIQIKVTIQKEWSLKNGEELTIYPAISLLKSGVAFINFDREYLNVKENGFMYNVSSIPTNNTPAMVGTVETNVSKFKPCRYDTITLTKQGDKEITTIFDSENVYLREKEKLDIGVISGKKGTYLLDIDFETKECENKPIKHKQYEIIVKNYPKNYSLIKDASSKAPHYVDPKKEGWEVKSSGNISFMGGFKTSAEEISNTEQGVISVKENQVAFDAFYNYAITLITATTFMEAMNYFWLTSIEHKFSTLQFRTESCVFKQDINIKIYPDIKWSFVLAFNVNKDQIAELFPSWDQEKTVQTLTMGKSQKDVKKPKTAEPKEQQEENKLRNREKKHKDRFNDYIAYKEIEKQKKKHKLSDDTETAAVVKTEDKPEKGTLSSLIATLQKVDLSVKAQINEDTELKLTDDFFKNTFNHKLYQDIFEQLRYAVDMIDGKLDNPKNKVKEEANIKNFIDQNKNKLEKLKESLKRADQEVEIQYPKISIGANWQYENVNATKHPALAGNVGIGYNVTFVADPFIGIEIKWHLLDMLCKRHPISYAILAAVKGLLSALGDNPDGIRVDFTVTGQISTDINFKGNTLSKDNQLTAKGASHVEAKLEIEIKIRGEVVRGGYHSIAEVGVGGTGAVGLGIESTLGLDDTGIWMQNALIFDGIKLSFEVVAQVSITNERMNEDGEIEETPIVEEGGKIEGEVTLLEHTFKSDKLYFKS